MNSFHPLLCTLLLCVACTNKNTLMEQQIFTAERVAKTAGITVNGPIETVFPLFGAFEERKWARGWNPALLYPATEIMEEGTTFVTAPGAGKEEKEYLWRVTKYEPASWLLQYLVSTENRYWTITVQCRPLPGNQTGAVITYTYTGLNDTGNRLNREALQRMYRFNLRDWQDELNYFLAHGELLPEP